MDDGDFDRWSIPAERYPSPVCCFAFENRDPTVRGVNSAFEAQFGIVEEGSTVVEALNALGLEIDIDDLTRTLGEGRQFTVATADGAVTGDWRYAVQVVPPEAGEGGFLVFSELPDHGDAAGILGVNHVASVVSHDLRNPLDVAKAHLRAGRELNDCTHLEQVAQAHERMERIIQDVLTLARGEEVVEPETAVDLGGVAEAAWKSVETDDATLEVVDPLPTAVADQDRVSRLFENLFRNTIEHGSTGRRREDGDGEGVQVTVGRLDGATEGFYVADDGPGIPETDRDRVFRPGYSSDEHGTGLGLAIVARIVDLHSWSSSVTAADDGGARIEIHGVDPADG